MRGVRPLGTLLAVVLACVLAPPAGAIGEVSSPGGAVAAAPVPASSQALPPEYDAAASYEAQAACLPAPKPGAVALSHLIKRTYGQDQYVGISRACGNGGTSEHKEGRALDWMTSARTPRGRANAEAFVSWLVGPDAAGTPAGNAARLGVMYVVWNNRLWGAYAPDRGWEEVFDCLSSPGPDDDTRCHRNHVHVSLSWDGASGRTSFWDGTTLAPFCPSGRSDAVVTTPARAADLIAIPPVRVLSTREGVGVAVGFDVPAAFGDPVDPGAIPDPAAPPAVPVVAAPCRVRPAGWHGDSGGIRVRVTGLGAVPAVGVAAVQVSVRALGSTAPADISAWGPGESAGSVVAHARMNRGGQGLAVVPVAADGTIAVGTSAGATDLTVDVTGYFLAGDVPNMTVVSLRP